MRDRNKSLDSKRISLERAVHLRFSRFDEFVTAYSCNISMTGMFISSEKPREPGTTFSFEASVADDWKLIRGQAQVVWSRDEPEGEDRPAGMGVRFIDLDAQSRRLIRWLVEKHVQNGGTPFELGPIPKELRRRPGPPGHAAPAPPEVARLRRRVRATVAVLLLIVAAVALTLAVRSAARILGAGGSESPRADTGPPASATTAQETVASNRPAAAAPAARVEEEGPGVSATVQAWARAWSGQQVDEYLAFYARDFRLPRGVSRSQWEAQRRERLTAPRHIWVAITNLQIESPDSDRRSAVFFQTYRSDRFEDTIRKSLELIREDGRWKILDERVLGPAD